MKKRLHLDISVKHRMEMVELLAKGDKEYARMLQENAELERKYDAVIAALPTEQMDIICDFLAHCEEMSERMLELACIHMQFQE